MHKFSHEAYLNSQVLRITFQGLGTIFMKFASCILSFFLSDPVDEALGILLWDPVDLVPGTFILL